LCYTLILSDKLEISDPKYHPNDYFILYNYLF